MSMSPPELPTHEPEPQRKSGMSTGGKVLIFLGVALGLLVLLCCGGAIVIGLKVSNAASDRPETIISRTQALTPIDVPEGFEPIGSLDMDLPFFGQAMAFVIYEDASTDSHLMLISSKMAQTDTDLENVQRSMKESLEQQGGPSSEDIDEEESYSTVVTIRGEECEFIVTKGQGAETGTQRIQVLGLFPGKEDRVFLYINADLEKYSEEEIIGVLESLE